MKKAKEDKLDCEGLDVMHRTWGHNRLKELAGVLERLDRALPKFDALQVSSLLLLILEATSKLSCMAQTLEVLKPAPLQESSPAEAAPAPRTTPA